MYFSNGYVYGDSDSSAIKIKSVKVLKDRIMLLTFSTDEIRLFDSTILKGPAFKLLENEEIFSNPKIIHGVVTWNNEEIDCAPEYMYKNSFEYNTNEIVVA